MSRPLNRTNVGLKRTSESPPSSWSNTNLKVGQHPENENLVDVILPLIPNSNGTYRWQKRNGAASFSSGDYGWSDTTKPFSTPLVSDTTSYRVVIPTGRNDGDIGLTQAGQLR